MVVLKVVFVCKGQGMFHCWVTCSYRLNIFHGKKYT